MIEFFRGKLHRREQLNRVVQLRYDLERIGSQFDRDTSGYKTADEEFQSALSSYINDIGLVLADIAQIETDLALKRAEYWQVPIPQRPYGNDGKDETDIWKWHNLHGRYYLTDKGLSTLRRESYLEFELWSKPWLSFTAIGISIVSLVISLLRA